ncbi:MAG: transporter substrate-binding domain-containing protein, partial [Nitrospirota bacterium]
MASRLKRRAFLWAALTICTIGVTLGLIPASAGADETLARVKSRKVLRCGVSEGLIGFSFKDKAGEWAGLDVDFCRAVAAAVGERVKVQCVPLFASAR